LQFLFLNNALNDFLNAIQNVWSPFLQMEGVKILLALSFLAFFVHAIELVATEDIGQFLFGLTFTIISIAVLYAVFINSQAFAFAVRDEFQQLAQRMTGESPSALTPAGVMEQGLRLVRIFWNAAGHASFFRAPISALETMIASIIVVIAFGIASIIYLLALIEVQALIVGGLLLLAFAASPWTWDIFPGWGLRVLSACVKIFFLLAVLAIGLQEAQGWATDMAGRAGTFADDVSRLLQVAVEAVLFLGCVYYLPGLFASMVTGGAGAVMTAGEAMIGSIGASAAGQAGGAMQAVGARGVKAAGAAVGVGVTAVQAMLFR